MKLLKLIVLIFIFYMIRRFIQMYSAVKRMQTENLRREAEALIKEKMNQTKPQDEVIEADFKVVDR